MINDLVGKMSDKSTLITTIQCGGKMIENPKETCENFNKHFNTAGKKVVENLQVSNDVPHRFIKPKTAQKKIDTLTEFNEIELTNVINNIPNKTSCGHDGISNILIKKIVYQRSYTRTLGSKAPKM